MYNIVFYIIKEFKWQSIHVTVVIRRVSQLFEFNKNISVDFIMFLPLDYDQSKLAKT